MTVKDLITKLQNLTPEQQNLQVVRTCACDETDSDTIANDIGIFYMPDEITQYYDSQGRPWFYATEIPEVNIKYPERNRTTPCVELI